MKNILILLASLFTGASCDSPNPRYKNVDNAEFAALTAREGVQLIDVRTPGEFSAGHLPGAVNIDVNDNGFDALISKLDTVRPVAVYCRSGARSRTAAAKLSARGFEVYNLDRGILGWDGSVER